MNYTFSATHIFLHGGRLFVGWEDKPMKGNVEIILRGDWTTEEMYLPFGGPTIGSKAIGRCLNIYMYIVLLSFLFIKFVKLLPEILLGLHNLLRSLYMY